MDREEAEVREEREEKALPPPGGAKNPAEVEAPFSVPPDGRESLPEDVLVGLSPELLAPIPGTMMSQVEVDAARIRLGAGPRRGEPRSKRTEKPVEASSADPGKMDKAEYRLMLLDTWQRSGLCSGDFSSLVGVSKNTLYKWKKAFEARGPAGLMDGPRGGVRGSRLSVPMKRSIEMLAQAHPEYGCEAIRSLLIHKPGYSASPEAVLRVMKEAGLSHERPPLRNHNAKGPQRFERARPNQLSQTDLFTFTLKRQNRRVYLIAFMDDHSRFITGYGLHSTPSSALVVEVLRNAIKSFQAPEEVLTDNGPQYVSWRGKTLFVKECEKQGIKHIVSAVRHPQTLGKIERFWGTLYRSMLSHAVFADVEDARRRIGLFIDWYNFHRPHSSLDGLAPAERFFGATSSMLQALKARVRSNSLELARDGVPRKQFFMAGQVGGKSFSLYPEGERLFLVHEDGRKEEVELATPHATATPEMDAALTEEEKQDLGLDQPVCPEEAPSLDQPVCPEGTLPEVAGVNQVPGPQEDPLAAGLRKIAESLGQKEVQA